MQRRIRPITQSTYKGTTYGITIPPRVASAYETTFFTVVTSGPNIILLSGAQP